MSLTGVPLLVLLATLTVLGPLALAMLRRSRPGGRGRGRRLLAGTGRFVGILLCQVCAVSLVAVLANDSLGFYNSWSDLAGGSGQLKESVVANGLVSGDGSSGSIDVISVAVTGPTGRPTRQRLQVLVWLPPQYSQWAYAHSRFPVLMMLPGQPGTPEGIFRDFTFATNAVKSVESHATTPFVAVFPPLMVAPPRDTECTDIPDGPQAETWLSGDVRRAVVKRFRVADRPEAWSVMGFSTGGFCAAKLLLRHRDLFSAAVGIGAYYDAETDPSTGDLFRGSADLRRQNSPVYLIRHPPGRTTHLMIIVSTQDHESYRGVFYADSADMIRQTATTPGVATILLTSGGHSYQTYTPTLPKALAWLGAVAGL